MAYASVSPLSSRTATVQRPASAIHRCVGKSAVRTRLACGCLSHNHTCKKHTVSTAHAVRQGSAPVGAMSTAMPSTRSCRARGLNGQGLFSAVRTARRAASVSLPSLVALPSQSFVETTICDVILVRQLDWPAVPGSCSLHRRSRRDLVLGTHNVIQAHITQLHCVQAQVVRASSAEAQAEETASGKLLCHC